MCPPQLLKELYSSLTSRQSMLKFGLAAGATVAAVGLATKPAHAASPRPINGTHIKDLTQLLSPDTPRFTPFEPSITLTPLVTHEANGYFGNVVNYWEHSGTHIDAPIHCDPHGLYVDQIEPEKLIAPIALIDIAQRAAQNPDTQVTPDDILAYERRYGRLPDDSVVLMNSGWGARYSSSDLHRNVDSSGVPHFPGFSKETVEFLLAERSVVGIGVDTLSFDFGPSPDFAAHYVWLPAGKWGLENLANLDAIPHKGATIVVGAPKVSGGSGGHSRVFALW